MKPKPVRVPLRLVEKELWGAAGRVGRFVLAPDDGAELPAFAAGQYASVGIEIDGALVKRPYSFASSPADRSRMELFIARVDDGELSPRLFATEPGDRWTLLNPRGEFTLARTARRGLVLASTGTGLGPFRSIVADLADRGALGDYRIVVANGAREAGELGYRAEFETRGRARPDRFWYLPTVSRPGAETPPEVSHGRVDRVLRALLGEESDPSVRLAPGVGNERWQAFAPPRETAVYLCGNPDMIADLRLAFGDAGYDEVFEEEYW